MKMRRNSFTGSVAVYAVLLLSLSGCSAYSMVGAADDQDQPINAAPDDTPEVIQARRVLRDEVEKTPLVRQMQFDVKPGDVRSITYTDPSNGAQNVVEIVQLLPDSIVISYSPGAPNEYPAWKLSYTEYQGMKTYFWLSSSWSQSDAQAAADALKTLVLDARSHLDASNAAALETFKQTCQGWSAQTAPAMPDEARQHQATAESDYARSDLDDAGDEYLAAMRIYPCWPEGLHKRAEILGATGWYTGAIDGMRRYLILLPNAPDAQTARNQIAVWQRKMGD
jgi:hypothetical protein